ncbi:MAG: glycosyltransferase family 2 protein [Alphaproteobacteria bacterium]
MDEHETSGPERPLVSAVIPAYNASGTILRALESVRIQDYEPIEVIVVDDGSADGTGDLVASYEGRGIRLITLDRNQGECGAMNVGIREAKGEYIAFLDADDEWLEGKITRQVEQLQANPRLSFVVCDSMLVGRDGSISEPSADDCPMVEGAEAWRRLLLCSFVAKPCVVARRSTLLALDGFNPALSVAGDQEMWIRLALAGEVGCIRKPLVRVHDTPGSLMSRNPTGVVDYLLPMIERHVEEQRHRLSKREIREILGARYAYAGRYLYTRGAPWRAIGLVLKGLVRGDAPLGNLAYLLIASPPVRWLAARLRRR